LVRGAVASPTVTGVTLRDHAPAHRQGTCLAPARDSTSPHRARHDLVVTQRCSERRFFFLFVPTDQVSQVAAREGATPYDAAGAELNHRGKESSFDAFCRKYGLWEKDPALVLMAEVVNGADTDNTLWSQPESAGLKAIAEGFRHLG
jgi:hypothetical protein